MQQNVWTQALVCSPESLGFWIYGLIYCFGIGLHDRKAQWRYPLYVLVAPNCDNASTIREPILYLLRALKHTLEGHKRLFN